MLKQRCGMLLDTDRVVTSVPVKPGRISCVQARLLHAAPRHKQQGPQKLFPKSMHTGWVMPCRHNTAASSLMAAALGLPLITHVQASCSQKALHHTQTLQMLKRAVGCTLHQLAALLSPKRVPLQQLWLHLLGCRGRASRLLW